jgi:hypothetical protein
VGATGKALHFGYHMKSDKIKCGQYAVEDNSSSCERPYFFK